MADQTVQSILTDLPEVQRIVLAPSMATPSYLTIVQLANMIVTQHAALAKVADWTVGAQQIAAQAAEDAAPVELAEAAAARTAKRAT